jgi:uncharacterized protein (TIGR03437 family)
MKNILVSFVLLCGAAPLLAQPVMRIDVPKATQLPAWVSTGTNGPADLQFEVWNSGNGSLNPEVGGGASAWLKPVVSGTQPCRLDGSRTCFLVRVLFESAGLANGTYNGQVRVSDPNAIDSPYLVPIKIYVGGNVPDQVDFYVAPVVGSSDSIEFETPPTPRSMPMLSKVSVSPAGQHLRFTTSGLGSFQFDLPYKHRIVSGFRDGMPSNDVDGSFTVTGSEFPPDNRTVSAVTHVTASPIVVPSVKSIYLLGTKGAGMAQFPISLSNRGLGELAVSAVTVQTSSGGEWLSSEDLGNNVYRANGNGDALEPGIYQGSLSFASNAANSPLVIPVTFELQPQGPPALSFGGAVNAASFAPSFAPGGISSVFGTQLAFETAQAQSLPVPTTVADTQVMVNGTPAPIFFASPNQINFQAPFEVQPGIGNVQVVRGGMAGNKVTARIDGSAPGLFRIGVGEYGAIVNASQGNFPFPTSVGVALGVPAAPARPGDIIVLFGTGLGPVNPAIGTGQAALASPLSFAVDTPNVVFVRVPVTPGTAGVPPAFVGLTPGFAGLFQINVKVPLSGLGTNPRTAVTLYYAQAGIRSNTVEIAVER